MREAIVFEQLWKPRLIKGLPRDYLIFLALIAPVSMVISEPFTGKGAIVGFVIAIVGYGYGYIKARNDPEFFSVWFNKKRLGQTSQRPYKGNEYRHE